MPNAFSRPMHRAARALLACAALSGAALAQAPLDRSIAQVSDMQRSRSAQPAPPPAPKRLALVIGNADYRSLAALKNPANDARDICEALRQLQFETVCQANVADRAEFRRLLRQFAAQLGPETMAFFYYAGHAVQLRGDNYLLPVKVSVSNQVELEDDSVALSHVLRLMEDARSAPNVIVLDACRDDPFLAEGRVQVNPGLARIEPPVGSLLVYATAPGRTALDGDGRNGLFTKHLLAHLKHPSVPLSELLQQVASDVEREARERYGVQQVPYRSFSYSGSLCLADCDEARAAAQLAELKRRSELAVERMKALEAENARLSAGAAQPTKAGQPLAARDAEMGELRQLLLSYQQRIDALERDAGERTRSRGQARATGTEPKPRPVVVPNF